MKKKKRRKKKKGEKVKVKVKERRGWGKYPRKNSMEATGVEGPKKKISHLWRRKITRSQLPCMRRMKKPLAACRIPNLTLPHLSHTLSTSSLPLLPQWDRGAAARARVSILREARTLGI